MTAAERDRALLARVRLLLPNVHGWCTPEKAERLVRSILTTRGEIASPTLVEIGVFGGSSLFPQALALQELGLGVIYGIDPWRADAALESMIEPANRTWWGSVDLDRVYRECAEHVRALDLARHCRLIRARAEDVVQFFDEGQIDLLHVDGNHSDDKSAADVALYLPKVARGGLVFFDDVSWTEGGARTTTRAVRMLEDAGDRLEGVGDCAVFRKR